MLSAAVIGARRRRQGIGEHVARDLVRGGAEVRAIVGTRPESVDEARRALEERHSIRCRGYTDLGEMLDAEAIDLLVICSPIAAHRAGLDAALGRRLHALCEKPLLYDESGGFVDEVNVTARRFLDAGRYLDTMTQWPFTLPGFRRLHPTVDLDRVDRFGMLLSPTATGARMLVDSLPHPISMLRTLVGGGAVRGVSAAWAGDQEVAVRFRYEHARGKVECEVVLRRCLEPPRPASYTINGHEAVRLVRLPDYAMELVDGDRRVPIEDPLGRRVSEYLRRLEAGYGTEVDSLTNDAAALRDLVRGAALNPPSAL